MFCSVSKKSSSYTNNSNRVIANIYRGNKWQFSKLFFMLLLAGTDSQFITKYANFYFFSHFSGRFLHFEYLLDLSYILAPYIYGHVGAFCLTSCSFLAVVQYMIYYFNNYYLCRSYKRNHDLFKSYRVIFDPQAVFGKRNWWFWPPV